MQPPWRHHLNHLQPTRAHNVGRSQGCHYALSNAEKHLSLCDLYAHLQIYLPWEHWLWMKWIDVCGSAKLVVYQPRWIILREPVSEHLISVTRRIINQDIMFPNRCQSWIPCVPQVRFAVFKRGFTLACNGGPHWLYITWYCIQHQFMFNLSKVFDRHIIVFGHLLFNSY